jgi:hypothetical protein
MKILFFLLLFFSLSGIHAQGNLQFNRVINLKYTAVCSSSVNTNVASITVPADKVWKIESASICQNLPYYSIRDNTSLYIDGQLLVQNTNPSNLFIFSSCPIWLSPGTYPLIVSNANTSSFAVLTSLSIIEFNVVP